MEDTGINLVLFIIFPRLLQSRVYCWNIKLDRVQTQLLSVCQRRRRRRERESAGADSSIKSWVIVHFISVWRSQGGIMTRHLQPREKCERRERAAQLQTRPGFESKIPIGAGIIPACRHGSVELPRLSSGDSGSCNTGYRCISAAVRSPVRNTRQASFKVHATFACVNFRITV